MKQQEQIGQRRRHKGWLLCESSTHEMSDGRNQHNDARLRSHVIETNDIITIPAHTSSIR